MYMSDRKIAIYYHRTFSLDILITLHKAEFFNMANAKILPLVEGSTKHHYQLDAIQWKCDENLTLKLLCHSVELPRARGI